MWKVGHRVEIVESDRRKIDVGIKGTVIEIDKDIGGMTVEFDKEMDGHDGDGVGKDGYCWYFFKYPQDLEITEQDGITIRKIIGSKKNNYW